MSLQFDALTVTVPLRSAPVLALAVTVTVVPLTVVCIQELLAVALTPVGVCHEPLTLAVDPPPDEVKFIEPGLTLR